MNLRAAYNLAAELMKQHGLPELGWNFEFDRARQRFGLTSHSKQLITMSRELTRLNSEQQVRDTILHEIAHALVGRGHGHDDVWRSKAMSIGCNGHRCYDNTVIGVDKKYRGTCPNCGYSLTRFRRKHLIHTRCKPSGNATLQWTLNDTDVRAAQ